ncbi:hypothetical protein NIES2104_66380 [Leptolyngbya sp. NIES-2104]|nr:hypothetical protein NIES2104_66380 [Leptolyngbya sp. NIES-2104]
MRNVIAFSRLVNRVVFVRSLAQIQIRRQIETQMPCKMECLQ